MRDTRSRDTRLRDSLGNEVGRLFRMMSRRFNKVLKPHGMSSVQANILGLLWLNGPMTIGEAQAALAIQSSTITGAIDRMEKLELVTREPVEGDRRVYRLVPAKWPAAKRDRLIDLLMTTEEACFGALTKKEQKTLLALLRKVTATLD